VICVIVMMLAALTLVPALVAIVGTKVFWPSKAWQKPPSNTRFIKSTGKFIARRPGAVAALIVIVLLVLASFALNYKADFSSFSQPPKNSDSASAFAALSEAFPPGVLSPTQVYVVTDQPITKAETTAISLKLLHSEGVAAVLPAVSTKTGTTTQITVILKDSPYSAVAIDNVSGPIRDAAHSFNSSTTHVYVGGGTSAIADVQAVTNRDLRVIFPIAALFIFIILAVLLRSLVAPIVLLLCVSLGYAATLGATTLIFVNFAGYTGLISFIPLFMYIFVVAIGTDYNILTITRLREEVREGNDPHVSAELTIEHSSATVFSAGLILAATFASLILGGISFLTQMGASIAIGVTLAAFVIAPFLIPSLSAVIGYAIWWPGHKPAQKS